MVQGSSYKFWWCYLPVFLLPIWYAIGYSHPEFYKHYIDSEMGVLENMQIVVLLICTYFAYQVLKAAPDGDWIKKFWGAAFIIGSIYIAGEEASWGQHHFSWETMEWFKVHNDQLETNIHNTSSWFDQKPRLLLEIWFIFFGILYPLFKSAGVPYDFSPRVREFLPSRESIPTALCIIAGKLIDVLHHSDERVVEMLQIRHSEVVELYLHWALIVYAAYLAKRWREIKFD